MAHAGPARSRVLAGTVLATLATLGGAAQAAAPVITAITPALGPPDSTFTIKGKGLGGTLAVAIGGTPAEFVQVSARRVVVTVPEGATGGPVTLTTVAGTVTSAFSFHVVTPPSLVLDHSSGPPTSQLTVTGTGFGPHEAVDLYLDATAFGLGATAGDGSFPGVRLRIPATATPGTHWVTAVGRTAGDSVQLAFLVRTDWASARADAALTGFNPFENVLSPASVPRLTLRFTVAAGLLDSAPAVGAGIAYVADDQGVVSAFDARTGALRWAYASHGSFQHSSPTVAVGTVFAGTNDGRMLALDAATGVLRWAFPAGGFIVSAPTVADGIVWFGTGSGTVHGLDAATGARRWSAALGAAIDGPVAVAGSLIYATARDGFAYAVDRPAGDVRWKVALGGDPGFGGPAAAGGMVFVGSSSGLLFALNAETGAQRWVVSGATVDASPAVADGLVHTVGTNGVVQAVDVATGAVRWTAPIARGTRSCPSLAGGVVYVAAADQTLAAFDAVHGTRLATVALGSAPTFTAPAVADGLVYVACHDGQLYALGLPDPPASSAPGRG